MENPFQQITDRLDRIEAVLTSKPMVVEDSAALTLTEAAEYLNISHSKLYVLCQSGAIPRYRVGTKYLFLRSALRKWLESQASK